MDTVKYLINKSKVTKKSIIKFKKSHKNFLR